MSLSKLKFKDWIKVFSFSFMIAMSLLMFITFLNAFVHGMNTTIYINHFGEAIPELILFSLGILCMCAHGYYVFKDNLIKKHFEVYA